MSVLLNWKEARDAIVSGNNFQYPDAISHYLKMKERMFKQIRMNQELKNMADAEIANIFKQDFETLYSQLNNSTLWELSYNSLTDIQRWVSDRFEGESGSALQNLQERINKLEMQVQEKRSGKSEELAAAKLEMRSLLNTEMAAETCAARALSSAPGGDVSTVMAFLESFVLNSARWWVEVKGKTFINSNATTTLMGYYKELFEAKALKQLLEKFHITNATSLQVSGANTINDLLLSFNNLNGSVEISDSVGTVLPQDENFGIQIKARDINKIGTGFMKISRQAGLRDGFNAQINQSGFNNRSWCCGVSFLGQSNNIIQSLGANNVMFISGPTRYFMDDFIQHFRKEQMYLAFQMGDDGKVTSQVGLQRFVEKRSSQKLLRRFR